jgi:hypothetical protein
LKVIYLFDSAKHILFFVWTYPSWSWANHGDVLYISLLDIHRQHNN